MSPKIDSYVIDVKLNDENEILKLSYNTKWNDISMMLLVKYDCEEGHWFTFSNKDDFLKKIDSQSDYDEALEHCAENFNTLSLQIWPSVATLEDVNKARKSQLDAAPNDSSSEEDSTKKQSQYLIVAGKALGDTVKLASDAVKTAMNHFTPSASSPETEVVVNQTPSKDIEMESLKATATASQCSEVDRQEKSAEDKEIQTETVGNKTQPKCTESDQKEVIQSAGSDLVERIKQEVQVAVRNELKAIRDEIAQLVVAKQQVEYQPISNRSVEILRADIKMLKREMGAQRSMAFSSSFSGSSMAANAGKQARSMEVCVVCENLSGDGHHGNHVDVGESFDKCWVLKNKGSKPWLPGITLKLVDEEPDSRFSSVAGNGGGGGDKVRDLWRVYQPVPALDSGSVTAVSILHTAPGFRCAYTTTWSLCIDGDLFGPLLRCEVRVGEMADEWPHSSGTSYPLHHQHHHRQPLVAPVATHFNAQDLEDEEDEDDGEMMTNSRLSSFKLTDDAPASHNVAEVVNFVDSSSADKNDKPTTSDAEDKPCTSKSCFVAKPSTPPTSNQAVKKGGEEDEGESSDFEVIPIPSCFDLSRPFKSTSSEQQQLTSKTAAGKKEGEGDDDDQTTPQPSLAGASSEPEPTARDDGAKERRRSSGSSGEGELVEAPALQSLTHSDMSAMEQSSDSQPRSLFSIVNADEALASLNGAGGDQASAAASSKPRLVKEKPTPPAPAKKVQLKKVQPAKRHQQQQQAPSGVQPTDDEPTERRAPVKVKSPANRHKRKLMQLREMGFGDDSFNRHLLDQFNGDIASVVNALVTHMSGLGGGGDQNAPLGSYVM